MTLHDNFDLHFFTYLSPHCSALHCTTTHLVSSCVVGPVEQPTQYYKNGKPKKKKLLASSVAKEAAARAALPRHGSAARLLERRNYAFVLMDSEDSFRNLQRSFIKLFGIQVAGQTAAVRSATELKSFLVEVGDLQSVKTVSALVRSVLGDQFESHISDLPSVVESSK